MNIFLAKIVPNGNYLWVRHIGGAGEEVINDMAIDGNGDCYIAGHYTNTATAFFPGTNLSMTSNNGSMDMFALKYNSDGSYGHGTLGGYSELNWLTSSMNISIIDGVGIDKLPIAGITVYPNPANDILSIQSEQQVLENLNIIIYNLNGQVILENKINTGQPGDKYTLNIPELQPAVYILELRNSQDVNKYRIVKH